MNIINTGLKFRNKLTKRKKTVRLIIHHAAAGSASVATVHQWHLNRGWAGIGYNFYITKDGIIYQGRGWDYVGAHCSGYNSTSLGICFEGNYDTEKDMPAAQYNAGVGLIRDALSRYPAITEICGHKAHGATACPGRYFPLEQMIAGARKTTEQPATQTQEYYPAYTDAKTTLSAALKAVGVNSTYTFRKQIAAANNITGYRGTAAQNTQMYNLLVAGLLKRV